jgi:hypothetical protein
MFVYAWLYVERAIYLAHVNVTCKKLGVDILYTRVCVISLFCEDYERAGLPATMFTQFREMPCFWLKNNVEH